MEVTVGVAQGEGQYQAGGSGRQGLLLGIWRQFDALGWLGVVLGNDIGVQAMVWRWHNM